MIRSEKLQMWHEYKLMENIKVLCLTHSSIYWLIVITINYNVFYSNTGYYVWCLTCLIYGYAVYS